jgi:ubiquitin-protein ligase
MSINLTKVKCPKRIMTEIFSLISQDRKLTLHKSSHISFLSSSYMCVTSTVRGRIAERDITVHIHLAPDYPFNPPTVMVDHQPYANLFAVVSTSDLGGILKEKNSRIIFQQEYNDIVGLSCASILHTNNWRPCHQLQDIYNEIELILDIKQRLVEKLMAKIIFSSHYKIANTNVDMAREIAAYL